MVERRKEIRRPAFFEAKIGFDGRRFRAKCLIQNISENGAKIALRAEIRLPQEFCITISRHRTRQEHWVRVVWLHRLSLGVEFLPVKVPDFVG